MLQIGLFVTNIDKYLIVPHECVDQSEPYMERKGWGVKRSSMDATGEIGVDVECSLILGVLFIIVYIFIFCFSVFKIVDFVKGKILLNRKCNRSWGRQGM